MPWKASEPVTERMRFVSRYLDGERMTDLCREFEISRKTGYKFLQRYREDGPEGLLDQTRQPRRNPNRTSSGMVATIVELRRRYSTWGPKKLRARLEELHPGVKIPATSTIGQILKDEGLVSKRRRRRRAQPSEGPLKPSQAPNDLWCIDFKGQFRMKNRKYCYPLTVSDHYSRYLLGCEALEGTSGLPVQTVLSQLFRAHGLPARIRSDNGTPFASVGHLGWSRLTVWLYRLGIEPERIEPGHPEQNGRHERLHRTLKSETAHPPRSNLLAQQECFDAFRRVYNEERPHEALGMKSPSHVYHPSARPFQSDLCPLDYPLCDETVHVGAYGHAQIKHWGTTVHISRVLGGENVGIRRIHERTWLVYFKDIEIGYLDEENRQFLPSLPDKPKPRRRKTNLLPMSPV